MVRLSKAFTLIELLVVITIIVILLALLVAGLEKALKAAERSKCGAHLRNLAQSCRIYASASRDVFPKYDADTGPDPQSAMDLRGDTTVYFISTEQQGRRVQIPNPNPPTTQEAQIKGAATGLGHLVNATLLPTAKLADAVVCPSIDTTSAIPVKYGMDEIYADTNNPDTAANTNLAGPSYWQDPAYLKYRLLSSYNYRAMSYADAHGDAKLNTGKVGSNFPILSDMVSNTPTRSYGRKYAHATGWNVAFADAHGEYVTAVKTNAGLLDKDHSHLETDVLGDGTNSTTEMRGSSDDEKTAWASLAKGGN